MKPQQTNQRTLAALFLLVPMALGSVGCHVAQHHEPLGPVAPVYPDMPRELEKASLPTYRIEPPDILAIQATRVVPKSPYNLQIGDVVEVQVQGTPTEFPIAGPYPILPGGIVSFGNPYGTVEIAGKSMEEAQAAITAALARELGMPTVTVSLLQFGGTQQITGEHLVGPDGTVTLGVYGTVYVTGLTIPDAKRAIEAHLSQFLESPEVAVDVFAYNSKVYYVITEGAGLGDRVISMPVMGNETVLDAIANIEGLDQVSSKRIWIARPSMDGGDCQILPVDWVGVTKMASASTNYQILPGDRVFIAEDNLVAFDTNLAKVLAPWERIFGFATLGAQTATRLSGRVLKGGGNPQNFRGSGSF